MKIKIITSFVYFAVCTYSDEIQSTKCAKTRNCALYEVQNKNKVAKERGTRDYLPTATDLGTQL